MFGLGEKVRLIASSCHKKTGPRKNSIGYITPFDATLTVLNNFNLVALAADIKFLRYGNEKKDRFETKRVELVFPKLRDCTLNKMQRFMSTIDKHVENWDKIRFTLNISKDVPIVIAVPIYTPKVNFKTCSNQEFSCWFESCIMSPQINSFVNKTLISHHFFRNEVYIGLIQNLSTLRSMMLDKYVRQECLKTICKNREQRKVWVNTLRMLIITIKHIEQKKVTNKLRGELHHINSSNLYSILIPYLFYHTFFIFKNIYIKYSKFNKVITEIENTKTAILALTTKV